MDKGKPSVSVIKLAPVLVERLWGGTWLKEEFGYKTDSDHIGESWIVSAHPSGDCRILNSVYKGQTLSQLYNKRRDLFANEASDKFPLLIKFIDAKEDLSVQVHPGDDYAYKHEQQSGKSESWIILNTKPDTRILVGHSAKNREDLKRMIELRKWDQLLTYRPLNKGEIISIPSGTLHAICSGTSLLEIQQSSDVTYRLYDYDRLDKNGHQRELHLEKSIDVIDVPARQTSQLKMSEKQPNNKAIDLLNTPYFVIRSLVVNDSYRLYNRKHQYFLLAVLKGSGKIGSLTAKKGNSFIITSKQSKITIRGNMHIIIATK